VARVRSLLGLDLPPLEPGTPGDPGLFGPGSSVWWIGRERRLLLGGAAALLLQVAHPLVAEAVARHSDFERDPLRRLRATLDATLRVTFGDRRQAEVAAARVRAVHARVRGRLHDPVGPYPEGAPFDPTDPQLALWVHLTLIRTSLDTFDRFVRPLSPAERGRHWEEARPFARLFGVTDQVMPQDGASFEREFDRVVADDLALGSAARRLAGRILAPPIPVAAAPLLPLLRVVTAGLLPPRTRRDLGLRWSAGHRAAFSATAAAIRAAGPYLGSDLRFWPHAAVARHRIATDGTLARL
jgi:uncharacterized protein (DUF2236 family)